MTSTGAPPSIDSPRHDATIAKALRGQALTALHELLLGLRGADEAASGELLRGQEHTVYAGLVSVLLRVVFVLFAEARGLLPMESATYAASWSLTGLHAELLAEAARSDEAKRAMEGTCGAWGRVVTLVRALHDGASEGDFSVPPRGGEFLDPDAYPFLEGRPPQSREEVARPHAIPKIPDGAVFRALDALLTLGGERLRYGALDVEHLGTVYEGLMGHEVHIAEGPCLTLKPDDVVVNLERLASLPGEARGERLSREAGLVVKGKVARLVKAATTADGLFRALASKASPRHRELIPGGAPFLQPGEARRRSGAHYTSRAVTRVLVERTLGPLVGPSPSSSAILGLKVCDPAMGGGALLTEACRQLGEHLARAWAREGDKGGSNQIHPCRRGDDARRLVAKTCLHGVDRNPLAVHLARLSLWLIASSRDEPFTFVDHALRCGDSLVGLAASPIAGASIVLDAEPSEQALGAARERADLALWAFFSTRDRRARKAALAAARDHAPGAPGTPELSARLADVRARYSPFHWSVEFPGVFAGAEPGFDVIVGNPPWVSYAGRAAQPLAGEIRDFYAASSPAFHGFRNLQGLFVHRFAEMLRPGGRLGLVLPTSTSDLDGYEPTRRAHDAWAICDEALPDFGEKAFDGVFQPSMGLLSTRRPSRVALENAGPWPLERKDLDARTRAVVERLSALPPFPRHLFGERGFQSTGVDLRHFHRDSGPSDLFPVAVRVGSDIAPFLRRPAEHYCDPRALGGRLRPAAEWQSVKLLIRQTARYPMAVLSDGEAFRNSILAGFADAEWDAPFLVAYLNSTPVRWIHYIRHRDARQGMPQLKIAHLRAVPAPPLRGPATEALARLGDELAGRNLGITAAEQDRLDGLVAEILSLDDEAMALIRSFGEAMRR